MVIHQLEIIRRCPEMPLGICSSHQCRIVCPGEKARLQLAVPISARSGREVRRVQMLLELYLIKLHVVERAEVRGQAAQGPDEPQLRGDAVNNGAEMRLARAVEPGF